MEECRSRLKMQNWDIKNTNFQEIEMDCVLRCHVLNTVQVTFEDPAKLLMPKKMCNSRRLG